MPTLTRKRMHADRESWGIWYDDVRIGTICIRSGNPTDTDRWQWDCGFYPGSNPGEQRSGTAATFDDARAYFESAWRDYLPKRTPEDFAAWRRDRDATAEKYALWDTRKKVDPPSWGPGLPASRFMKCPCGEIFDMQAPAHVQTHVPHISARHAA